MKYYKFVSIILVPLILSLMIVKVNAGNNYIPADAKTMYNLGKSYLQSKNYHNLKLVHASTSSIYFNDTNLVTLIGTYCNRPTKEWNGKYYDWQFLFLADGVPNDSLIGVQVAYDTSKNTLYWSGMISKLLIKLPDTVSISDSDWINSDSVSKLPRLQNDPPCYWTGFFQGGYLEVTLMRNPFSRGGPFVWFLYQDIEHSFHYDAKTGEMLSCSATVGVNDEPPSTIQHSITPMPVSDVLQIQTSTILTSVTLYSLLGQKVSSWYDVAPNQLLSVSDVTSGSYLIQFICNGKTQTIPVCINH